MRKESVGSLKGWVKIIVEHTTNDGKVLILGETDKRNFTQGSKSWGWLCYPTNSKWVVLYGNEGDPIESMGVTSLHKYSNPDKWGYIKKYHPIKSQDIAHKIFFENYVNNLEFITFGKIKK